MRARACRVDELRVRLVGAADPVLCGLRAAAKLLVAAHQALFSFSADVKVEAVSDARNETTLASVVYMKPNKARVELKLAQGARIVSVCDGTTRLYSDGKKHQKVKAESGEKAIIETLSQTGLLIAPVFLYLTSRASPVRTLLPGATKVLGFTTPTTLDGVLVDVVAAEELPALVAMETTKP